MYRLGFILFFWLTLMVAFAGAACPFAATATPVALSAKPSVTAPAISLRLRIYFLSAPEPRGGALVGSCTASWE